MRTKQRGGHAVQKFYTSAAPLGAELAQSLKVVVEHSRMTDQTHLLRSFDRAGSDHGATPRADDVIRGLSVPGFVVRLRIHVLAHMEMTKQILFQRCARSRQQ